MRQVTSMEPTVEEGFWPGAIFLQNREGTNFVIYIDEIIESKNTDEKEPNIMPEIEYLIKSHMPDYLAVVYKTDYVYGDGSTEAVLAMLVGDILDLEYYEADYFISDNKYKLENFEQIEREAFPDEAQIIRKSMTYQDQ